MYAIINMMKHQRPELWLIGLVVSLTCSGRNHG